MNNKQYHIVKRNNYFLGKLMTARDFFTEQEYFNSRRRLLSKFMFGSGIVAGMSIFLVDDKSFSLEPGFAIDYYGREIIVDQTYVRKLNLIKGFDNVKDKPEVYICIKYKEVFDESTFSVTSASNAEDEKQFNRIKETFELFLTDKAPQKFDLKLDGLLFHKVEIYNANKIKIWAEFPKYANLGKNTKVKIFFEKDNAVDNVAFKLKVSGVLFENSASVSFDDSENPEEKFYSQECYMRCNANNAAMSELIISKSDFSLRIGTKNIELEDDIRSTISIREEHIKDIIISDYFSLNFDKLIEDNDENYIYLAKVKIVSDGINYIIEKFEPNPAKQFLLNNEILRLMEELNKDIIDCELNFAKQSKKHQITQQADIADVKHVEKLIEKDNVITGVETINLGFKPKPGKVYYSYEFVHGLGKGNIAVVTATVNDENPEFEEKNLLVFGDRSIFDVNEADLSVPDVQIASIVDPAKGTMRIGVRLEERTNVQSIKVRWWAIKPLESEAARDNLVIDENLKIVVSPDSITIKPLDQIRFSAKIIGAEDQRISWSLGKNNPGKIDANGLYTAPATEGIFEIIAQAVNFADLHASAYVVVTTEFSQNNAKNV